MVKVLKFYANWCMPCKVLSDAIKKDPLEGVEFVDVNIDDEANGDLIRKFAVRGIPLLVKVDEAGEEISRSAGILNTQQLRDFVFN